MDEAKDFDDFAEILCARACKESFPPLTNYFAYFFAYDQGKYNIMDRIQEAGRHTDLAKPLLLAVQARRGVHVEWNEFQKALSKALKETQGDWIACHVYMAWRRLVDLMYTESSIDSGPLSILESKIENDDGFSFFRSDLYRIKGNRLRKERSLNEATKMYNLAITQAKQHDNLVLLAILLAEKANLVKRTNIDEALSILELHREVCERIGFVAGFGFNAHQLGHIALAKGEFDLALHHQNKCHQILTSLGDSQGYLASIIALLYNMMRDGARALELIATTQQEMTTDFIPMAFIQEAWALVNLDKINDAETSLSKAKELVLKRDDEVHLGLTYFVEGLIEKARGEFASASYSLDNALGIFERYYSQAYHNMTLIHLTDIEVESFPYSTKNEKLDYSGPWMRKLLDLVAKKSLPGIEAQSKLLRAKFLFKQGQFTQSNKLVKEVLKTSKSSSMHYLENLSKLMLPELST